MNAKDRRERINEILTSASEPVPAGKIAEKLLVSRQIIVGDIALIRAQGKEILATPRGYILNEQEQSNNKLIKKIACRHDMAGMQKELYIIVDNGCTAIDVIVEHPYYGELTGQLHVQSRYDADEFIKKVEEQKVKPLSLLTNGIHVHTISYPNEESLKRTLEQLKQENILL